MKLVIGTDEAGYGPNLGPLVITGTSWLLADSPNVDIKSQASIPYARPDLLTEFSEYFVHCSEKDEADDRIRVGDSKMVYQSGSGLSQLERLVFSLVGSPPDWLQLLSTIECKVNNPSSVILPWYQEFNPKVPLSDLAANPSFFGRQIVSSFGSRSLTQRSVIIEPGPFNQGCREFGNKATLLSHYTLSLVYELIDAAMNTGAPTNDLGIEQVFVVCDKHGGRSKYAALLQELFAESWIRVIDERQEFSRYEFSFRNIPVHVEFLAKGESELPIAVASMFSKYIREVCMKAFNDYWQSRIPNLRPTAGYPVDAKRFRSEILKEVEKLDLQESDWWRER